MAAAAQLATEDFGALFEESIKESGKNEGAVITGIVVAVEKDTVIIDVGLKSEGRIPPPRIPGQWRDPGTAHGR